MPVVTPIEFRIHHNAQRSEGSVVSFVEGSVIASKFETKHGIGPIDAATDGAGVGIQQYFVRIETVPCVGSKGAVNANAIQLTGTQIGKISVPGKMCTLCQSDAVRLYLVRSRIKQTQFHSGGMLRKDSHIYAMTIPGGAKWVGAARPVTNRPGTGFRCFLWQCLQHPVNTFAMDGNLLEFHPFRNQ